MTDTRSSAERPLSQFVGQNLTVRSRPNSVIRFAHIWKVLNWPQAVGHRLAEAIGKRTLRWSMIARPAIRRSCGREVRLPRLVAGVSLTGQSRIANVVIRAKLAREAVNELAIPFVVDGLASALNEQHLIPQQLLLKRFGTTLDASAL